MHVTGCASRDSCGCHMLLHWDGGVLALFAIACRFGFVLRPGFCLFWSASHEVSLLPLCCEMSRAFRSSSFRRFPIASQVFSCNVIDDTFRPGFFCLLLSRFSWKHWSHITGLADLSHELTVVCVTSVARFN